MENKLVSELTQYQSIPLSLINDMQQKSTKSMEDIIDMLSMWGRYHHYRTQCGYQRVSAFFKVSSTTRNPAYIQEDIDIIDKILLTLKESSLKKQQQEYAVIEAYYKGIDLVVDGYDWSQKLTVRDIASYLNLPKSTVSNRKKSAELFVLTAINKIS